MFPTLLKLFVFRVLLRYKRKHSRWKPVQTIAPVFWQYLEVGVVLGTWTYEKWPFKTYIFRQKPKRHFKQWFSFSVVSYAYCFGTFFPRERYRNNGSNRIQIMPKMWLFERSSVLWIFYNIYGRSFKIITELK